jgi:hypothetical protein
MSTPSRRRRCGWRAWLLPIAASLAIVGWQIGIGASAPDERRAYRIHGGLGEDAPLFYYFFHHFGLFPVAALEVPKLGPSKQDAEAFVAQHGDRLRMEIVGPTSTTRFGDYGKLFLYVPGALLSGDPAHPSTTPFNALLFVAALLAVFWSLWREGYALLGAAIVVLVGSDPFQLFATYWGGNVHSVPISTALIALAAHARFLTGRKGVDALAWGIALISGAIAATLREVRGEAAIVAVGALLAYAAARAPLARRLALVALFSGSFAVTSVAWSSFWAGKFAQAAEFVERAGGVPFRVQVGTHHVVWHAVFCGLGDFGANRGFAWDDRVPYRWAIEYDERTNPEPLPYTYVQGHHYEETHDGVHPIAPTDMPEYNRLVRMRVLGEIRSHPLWYAGILAKRAIAIQREATPAALSIGSRTFVIGGAGWATLPVLLFALWRKRWFHALAIAFFLPLGAVALLVFSGGGTTWYGIAHLVAIAVAVDLLVRSYRDRTRVAKASA